MSSEVGSGHVSIFPVMTGFKARVAKETRSAGAAGAKTFEGGFKATGARAGRALGRDMKAALSSSAGNLGAAELRKLNVEVASASRALSSARLRQLDEAGRVRVAEAKLQETIAKSGAESSAATALMNASSVRATTSLLGVVRAFRAGWNESRLAVRGFTGIAGSIAGIVRATVDVTGVTRIARLVSAQVSRAFTSMATMVRGGLARAWSASKSWMSSVGSTVRGAFGPMLLYVGAIGTRIASPFIRLGSKVSTWLSPVTTQVRGLFSKLGAAIGPAASSIGSSAASALSTVVSAASRVGVAAGKALGEGIQSAATGAATLAATAIGVALGKGFGRLTAIDTAQAKLRGFGKDAGEIKAIMTDASASVKGTAFGLGEAATVAGAAVAANIKPGQQLQNHLKAIANNASAAGLSMQEMGSIFNKARRRPGRRAQGHADGAGSAAHGRGGPRPRLRGCRPPRRLL